MNLRFDGDTPQIRTLRKNYPHRPYRFDLGDGLQVHCALCLASNDGWFESRTSVVAPRYSGGDVEVLVVADRGVAYCRCFVGVERHDRERRASFFDEIADVATLITSPVALNASETPPTWRELLSSRELLARYFPETYREIRLLDRRE